MILALIVVLFLCMGGFASCVVVIGANDPDDEEASDESSDEDVTDEEAMSAVIDSVGLRGKDTSQIGNSDAIIEQTQTNVQHIVSSHDGHIQLNGSVLSRNLEKLAKYLGLIKIMLGFVQVVTTFDDNLPAVPWPVSLVYFWDFWSFLANMNLLGSLSIDCATSDFTFYDTFLLATLAPVFIVLSVIGVTLVRIGSTADEEERNAMKTQGSTIHPDHSLSDSLLTHT